MMQTFSKGIVNENPLGIYILGLCPVLAVSRRVIDAIAMGITLFVILVISNIAVAVLKNHIPRRFRVFLCTAIAGACASVSEMILSVYFPGISDSLGIFVPLLTVNSLILTRAFTFAWENTPGMSFWDALGMGTGFFLALLGLALIREILGNGTITVFAIGGFNGVIQIPGISQSPMRVVSLSAGGFLVLGYLKAIFDLMHPAGKNEEGRQV